jgi:hypothetical protein
MDNKEIFRRIVGILESSHCQLEAIAIFEDAHSKRLFLENTKIHYLSTEKRLGKSTLYMATRPGFSIPNYSGGILVDRFLDLRVFTSTNRQIDLEIEESNKAEIKESIRRVSRWPVYTTGSISGIHLEFDDNLFKEFTGRELSV